MPRTATTLAITHAGDAVLVAHPDLVGVVDQAAAFRKCLGQPNHPEFANLSYQESDGQRRIIKFNKPEKSTEHKEPKVSRKSL